MPYVIQKSGNQFCLHKQMMDGSAGDKVPGGCHPSRAEAMQHMKALYANVADASKHAADFIAVKATGDWELDVNAVPFHSMDSDQQWFDPSTDIMPDTFATPLIVYQHGYKQGEQTANNNPVEEKPEVIGKAVAGSWSKQSDGWHIRVVLDQAKQKARDVMEAARKGMAAVSSGSIFHLARLDVGGKNVMYDKRTPGRISVWGVGEISLWEMKDGNFNPANRMAYALPVMKAMYREAGIPFPELRNTGGVNKAQQVRERARISIEKESQMLRKFQ